MYLNNQYSVVYRAYSVVDSYNNYYDTVTVL